MYTVNALNAADTILEKLVKEDVDDLLSNLFPLDTPLQQILEKRPMNNVFAEMPVDTFSTAVGSGIVRTSAAITAAGSASATTLLQRAEGATYTASTSVYPARLKCVSEIQGIQFEVSDTNRALDQYAINDRYAYEALKTTQSVVNNFELSFWWALGSRPGGSDLDTAGGTTYFARMTQGLMPWVLFSGLQASSTTPSPATHVDGHGNDFGTTSGQTLLDGASSWAYNANGLTLDQTMFKDNLMAPWYRRTGRQAGAVGFASPRMKNLFSAFALTANGPINERTLDAAAKKVVDTVDWYDTDFGLVSINLSRYLSILSQTTVVDLDTVSDVTVSWDESLVFILPSYWKIGVVRPVSFTPLGKTGDFEKGLVRGEQALICRNPAAGAAIVNAIP